MEQVTIYKQHGSGADLASWADPRVTLLEGRRLRHNQTRVIAANHRSSMVRPADLDAFLQGSL